MTAPQPGQFTLHARAVPPLKAGDYRISGTQSATGAGDIAPYDGHLTISSPRYVMPPEQVLSTFPPANAIGTFEDRLPQIVLKRRTLPWDRSAGPGEPDSMPWLALVIIAEGEGQLSGETPVAQCVTPGKTLAGEADVPSSVYLAVSQTVVDAVFPTKQDVPLLAHVRQVDPSDTELALGDDDGFLAVIMANRLPQYHRSTGPDDPDRAVRYLACLVNLEQQLPALPKPTPPAPDFEVSPDVAVLNLATMAVTVDPDHYVMGGGGAAQAGFAQGLAAEGGAREDAAAQAAARAAASAPAKPLTAAATSTTASAAAWQTAPGTIAEVAVSAAPAEAARLVRDTMGMNFRYDVEQIVTYEPTYRFPVLAHWSFTADVGGSFQTYLQNLDVGLLGTAPPAPPAPPPGTPPPPAPSRPEAELTDTGHVGLPHLTRRGDATRAWYRGPLTPRPAGVDPAHPEVRLPLAHASDQLRRVTPDGREDLSLAGAFEIGRLLALSQPSVVAAQLSWRGEQFGAARAKRFARWALDGLSKFGVALGKGRVADLGRLLGRQVTLAAARDPATVLAPSRPVADPGRPLNLDGGVEELVARGFGLSADAVRAASAQVGLLAALRSAEVPVAGDDGGEFGDRDAGQLRQGLTDSVATVFSDAVSDRAPAAGDGAAPKAAGQDQADVLDELITAAQRRAGRDGQTGGAP